MLRPRRASESAASSGDSSIRSVCNSAMIPRPSGSHEHGFNLLVNISCADSSGFSTTGAYELKNWSSPVADAACVDKFNDAAGVRATNCSV